METLVPLIPGLVAGTSLALARVNVSPRGGDRTRLYWALLNLGLFVWTMSYFVGLAYSGWTDMTETRELAKFLFGVGQVGVAMTITYYFLFSAEVSGLNYFARGGWLFASHLPGVLIVASCCFGPLSQHFVTWGEGFGANSFAYGPVGNALIVALYGLVLTGAVLHLASRYEAGKSPYALPHGAFALAGFVPLAANVIWVLRVPVGFNLGFNPTVVAFLIANLVMLGSLKAWCRRTGQCAPGFDVVVAEQHAEGA